MTDTRPRIQNYVIRFWTLNKKIGGKVSGPLGGATEKTLIWRNFTNFKDMKTIESALESWNIIFSKIEKIVLVFWPLFVRLKLSKTNCFGKLKLSSLRDVLVYQNSEFETF